MAFRRSFDKVDSDQITRKAVVMTLAILIIIVLVNIMWNRYQQPFVNEIHVAMLNKDTFLVQQDTTNYDRFASLLKKAVIEARKEYPNNKIILQLPKDINQSGDISSIIMVVTAMDLDWQIKN